MWQVEGYDRNTEELVCAHSLPHLATSDVRRILRVWDGEPMEPFLFDVNQANIFDALAEFSDVAVAMDPARSYYLAFSGVQS